MSRKFLINSGSFVQKSCILFAELLVEVKIDESFTPPMLARLCFLQCPSSAQPGHKADTKAAK